MQDDLGRSVPLEGIPERIVSLCPSQTELLFDLGAGDRVVGVTKFCVHPRDGVAQKSKVGGTKDVNLDRVRALEPDLVLAQREENTREVVEALAQEVPVYVTDVVDVTSALRMIERVAAVVDSRATGEALAAEIRAGLNALSALPNARVLYLIWRDPWMAAGRGTFIHSVLEACGFENALATERYPTVDGEAMRALRPDIVFLSSEPFPFRDKHRQEIARELPDVPIQYVDGEVFSWYGSRMRRIPEYARHLRRFFGEGSA